MSITLVDVKKFLVDKIKAQVAICALLGNVNDVREAEWQGTNFKYPNIRVFVETFRRHTPGVECALFDVVAHVYVFADDASSLKTDIIAAMVWDLLDARSPNSATVKTLNIRATHLGAGWIQECRNMAKRSSPFLSSIIDADGLVIDQGIQYNIPEQTDVRSRFPARLEYTGLITGKPYIWKHAGDVVSVDNADVADLVSKSIGDRGCCGAVQQTNLLFEIV